MSSIYCNILVNTNGYHFRQNISLCLILLIPYLVSPPETSVKTLKNDNYTPNQTVSRKELLADIDFYVSKINEVHADPFMIITPEEFKEAAAMIKSEIKSRKTDSFDLFESYYFIQRLAALIADGHTKIYEPDNWEKMFDLFFPLNIIIIDGRAFVTKNAGNNDIPEKAEILAINGKNIQNLFSNYITFCEGTLDHYKNVRLAEYFRFHLQTCTRSVSPWVVDYSFNGVTESETVKGINLEDLKERTTVSKYHSEGLVLIDGEETPVLHLPSIGYSKDYFKPFIDKFFEKYRDKKNIILDFRLCPGGNGLRTYDILDHVAEKPYTNIKRFSFKVSQSLKEIVAYYIQSEFYDRGIPLENWREMFLEKDLYSDSYNEIYRNILSSVTGTFTESFGDFEGHIPDKTVRKYEGDLYILMSHKTFSAGVVFASAVKYNKLGIIVGRETGGRLDFLSDTIDIELPLTKLIAKIPSALLTLEGDEPTRGVKPDKAVDYTVEDFLSGKDPDIEAVKQLVRQKSASKNM